MTSAPRVQIVAFTQLGGAVRALRDQGLRLSTPRRLVLEALFSADGPVSAETISTRTGVDIASVYRNLETLEAHGVVQHVHFGHGPGLHTLAGPGEREYLHCDNCGTVTAVDPSELDVVRDIIRERFGLEARFNHFAIGGLCPDCRATGRPESPQEHLHSVGDQYEAAGQDDGRISDFAGLPPALQHPGYRKKMGKPRITGFPVADL